MAQNGSTAAASLEYKNRLEEMELRIRYMKNDIEFKQGQISLKQEAKSKQLAVKHALSNQRGKPHNVCRQSTSTACINSVAAHRNQSRIFERFSSSNLVPAANMQSIGTQITDHAFQSSLSKSRTNPLFAQKQYDPSHRMKQITHLSSTSEPFSLPPSSSSLSFAHLMFDAKPMPQSAVSPSPCHLPISSKPSQRLINSQRQVEIQTSTTLPPCSTPSQSMRETTSDTASGSKGINPHPSQPTCHSISPYKLINPSKPVFSTSNVTMTQASNISGIHASTSIIATNTASAEKAVDIPPAIHPKHFHSKVLSKRCTTPLKVHTAARLVCNKYNLKRHSPTSAKSAPSFRCENDTRTFVRPTQHQMRNHAVMPCSSSSNSRYKLVKPKVVSHPHSSVTFPKASHAKVSEDQTPNKGPSIYEGTISLGDESSSLPGDYFPNVSNNSGKKRRLSYKYTSKNVQSFKLQRMKIVTPILGSKSAINQQQLSSTRLAHSSSHHHKPTTSIRSLSSQWKNVFKLDKRGVPSRGHPRVSSFKLDKRLVRNSNHGALAAHNHSATLCSLKHGQSSKQETISNLYKWRSSQIAGMRGTSTKFIHRNAASVHRWHHHPVYQHPKIGSSQNRQESVFKWHRPNSHNGSDSILRQVEMARLKQRLRVIMAHRRNTYTVNRMKLARNAQSHQNPSPHTSSVSVMEGNGKNKRKEDVNRLVMIGHMLYRASSRKLTRADGGNAGLARDLSPNISSRTTCTPATSTSSLLSIRPTQKKLPESVVVKNLRPQKMKLVTVRGVRFHVESNGTKLTRVEDKPGNMKGHSNMSRVDIGGRTYVKTGPDTLELSCQGNKKMAASRAVHKSLFIVAAKQRKSGNRVKSSKQKHCTFFRRFGKCERGEQCPFIHDQDKVAVCTRFLRGQCDDPSTCPFSHDASAHKMPVCLFYLQGLCSREDCYYLHVKVSPDAPVCNDFLQGFCPLGLKCKKLHSFVCPCYAVFGKCLRREKCSLLHRQSKKQARVAMSGTGKKSRRRSFLAAKNSVIRDEGNEVSGAGEIPSHTNEPLPCSSCPSSVSLCSPQPEENLTSVTSLSTLPSNSTVHPNSLDSALKAQPSFISLLSTSSVPLLSPTKSSLCNVSKSSLSSTPATGVASYKIPKITPEFHELKKKDEVEILPNRDTEESCVAQDSATQDLFSSLSSTVSKSITEAISKPSSTATTRTEPIASPISTVLVNEVKMSPSLLCSSPISTTLTAAVPSLLNQHISPITHFPIDETREKLGNGGEAIEKLRTTDCYKEDILKFNLDVSFTTAESETFKPTSCASSHFQSSPKVTTNSGNVTPQTTSSMFNKGIIPSFMTKIMKYDKK